MLLIGLGRAELITEDETAKLWYQRQRSDVWSPFLSDALKVLAQTLRPNEEPGADRRGRCRLEAPRRSLRRRAGSSVRRGARFLLDCCSLG